MQQNPDDMSISSLTTVLAQACYQISSGSLSLCVSLSFSLSLFSHHATGTAAAAEGSTSMLLPGSLSPWHPA